MLRLNATHASCSVPAAPAGERESVDLALSLNGVDFAPTGLTFIYYRQPRITSHTPHGGPVACTLP